MLVVVVVMMVVRVRVGNLLKGEHPRYRERGLDELDELEDSRVEETTVFGFGVGLVFGVMGGGVARR